MYSPIPQVSVIPQHDRSEIDRINAFCNTTGHVFSNTTDELTLYDYMETKTQ